MNPLLTNSKQTTVDKLEWKRWEDGIRNVREIKEILTLDVNPENEEQLTTGLLQGVLVENLRMITPLHKISRYRL